MWLGWLAVALAVPLVGCSSNGGTPGGAGGDAGVEASSDARADVPTEAANEASSDARTDAPTDAGGDADAGSDGAPHCASAADCPSGQACDRASGSCTTACSASQSCNGGCCSAASGGTCVAGTAVSACGASGGACVDCTAACIGAHETCACTTQQCANTSITSFTAAPTTINQGASSTLSWATSGATTCSIDQGIGTVSCTGTHSVSPTATTTYTLTATGSGGTTTATAMVTVQYCHGIVDLDAGASTPCPSGATQFCESVPLVGTSSSQAHDACDACFGAGQCSAQSTQGWRSPNRTTDFMYTSGSNGSLPGCASSTWSPGDILDGVACPLSRWAP